MLILLPLLTFSTLAIATVGNKDQDQDITQQCQHDKTQVVQSGCCSWNKGVCGCRRGRVLCCNGKISPSCRCNSAEEEPTISN